MINVSVRRLEVFVAIAESGSFAGAARRLGIAQPSVSAHVQSLEKEAGVALFERISGRQARLTEAGRGMLAHARDLIERTARLEQELAGFGAAKIQSVSFACQRSLALTVLRAPLASFAHQRRDIRLSIRIAFQEEVLSAIRMGATDVGCFLSMSEPLEGQSLLIGRQRFVLFAPPDHPLARRRIKPIDLENCDFVGPVSSSHFGRVQQELLRSIGVQNVQTVAEGTEFSLVRDLVAAGLGIGCSLYESVRPEAESGRLVILDLDAPALLANVYLLTNIQRRSDKSVSTFVNFLLETFRDQPQP
jgi:molybdate transport repressor ModE-like protein